MRAYSFAATAAALVLAGGVAPDHASAQPAAGPVQALPKDRPISLDQRGPVSYEEWRKQILFKMSVGEREVLATLDTGSISLIDLTLARQLGFKLSPDPQVMRTITGDMTVWRAADVLITIPGHFKVNASEFRVADLTGFAKILNRNVEFVFGQDFLNSMALRVDPVGHKFWLAPTGRINGLPGADVFEVRRSGGEITATIAAGERPISVTIDTGQDSDLCVQSAVWTSLAPRMSSVSQTSKNDMRGVANRSRIGRMNEATFGKTKLNNIEVCEFDTPGYPNEGRVGYSLMSRFEFAIDASAGKMWLVPLAPPETASSNPPVPR